MGNSNPLGTAAARGVAGGVTPQNSYSKLAEAQHLSTMNSVPDNKSYRPDAYNDHRFVEAKAENYETVEQAWLQRLHRFGQIDTSLNAGKVNEGKPQ